MCDRAGAAAPCEGVQRLRGRGSAVPGDGAALGWAWGRPQESPGFLSSDGKPESRLSRGREQPRGEGAEEQGAPQPRARPAARGNLPPLILLQKETQTQQKASPMPNQGAEGLVTPTETTRSKSRREKATPRLALAPISAPGAVGAHRAPPAGEDTV